MYDCEISKMKLVVLTPNSLTIYIKNEFVCGVNLNPCRVLNYMLNKN